MQSTVRMGRFWLLFVWLLVAGLGGAPLVAQQVEVPPGVSPQVGDADLAALLGTVRSQHAVPALGALVLVDGEVAALAVDGLRRTGHEELVTVDDLWHLGSCTKAMTATLLALQVERGQLSWSTTMAHALPDLAAQLHGDARGITVLQLLQHRAGLPGGPPPALWQELFRYAGTTAEARTEVAATLLALAPEAVPGQRFLYSNASYMVAGAVAERVGGASWEELMQRELFLPLGMLHAGFGPPGTKDATTQPFGHRLSAAGSVAVFADNPPSLGPAGTVHASLRDWAQFAKLHLGVAAAGGDPLLPAAALAALHEKPPNGDYALGWIVTTRPWAKGPILTHSGSNTMWFCVAWLAPAARFGVLVVCNQGDAGPACDAVAAACIQRFGPAKKG